MVMLLSKPNAFRVTLLLLFVSMLAFQHAAEAQNSFPPTTRREASTTWEISGLVRAPSGLPVPNATYRVETGTSYQPMWRSRSGLVEDGQADLLGEFNVSVQSFSFVVAIAPGYAPTASGVSEGSYLEIELDTGDLFRVW